MTAQPDTTGTRQGKIRVGSPEGLVAVVPQLLRFMPASSIVVIGIAASGSVKVTLRYDLPDPECAAGTAADVIAILTSQRLTAAIAVGYGPEPLVTPMADALRHAAEHAGVDLRDVLRVEDNRYWSYTCANPACCPAAGTRFDYAVIAARTRISESRPVLSSRDALAATVSPLGDRPRQSMRQATRRAEQHVARVLATTEASATPDAARKAIAEEGIAVVANLIVVYRSSSRRRINYDTFAMATVALADKRVRDDTWTRMDPEYAEVHQGMWTDMVRRAQPGYVAAPACLLAFVAWQTGYGPLAHVALDRALADDPDCLVARMLRQIISAGAPPSLARFPMTPEQIAASYDDQCTRST
ncbi:MAG: DUF4192 domain-containing protein [Streptosporangiaceae bacterium]|nr:DUF4192 domain-containing protein [Streptosporangiaceae bacterium]